MDSNDFKLKHLDFHAFSASLLKTIEAKDPYTSGHSDRVADLAGEVALMMNLGRKFALCVHVAGHLHDLGKIGIPDGILLKTGRLTRPEYSVMQQHSVIGWEILRNVAGLDEAALVARHHHERYDGGGYPDQLRAKEIPLGARIIAVADSFDAMTTTRTYRQALSMEEALDEVQKNRNRQFDAEAADALQKIYEVKRDFLEKTFADDIFAKKARGFGSFRSLKSDENP